MHHNGPIPSDGRREMSGALSRPQRQVRLPQHIVDLAADELRTAEGAHVELRPRSWSVFRLLAEHAGRLVGKDDIIAKVWDDVAVTEDSLTQCIVDIRKAIGDDERRVLRTVPRKGYMLVPSQHRMELAGRAPDLPSLAVMPFLSIGTRRGSRALELRLRRGERNHQRTCPQPRLALDRSRFFLCARQSKSDGAGARRAAWRPLSRRRHRSAPRRHARR